MTDPTAMAQTLRLFADGQIARSSDLREAAALIESQAKRIAETEIDMPAMAALYRVVEAMRIAVACCGDHTMRNVPKARFVQAYIAGRNALAELDTAQEPQT